MSLIQYDFPADWNEEEVFEPFRLTVDGETVQLSDEDYSLHISITQARALHMNLGQAIARHDIQHYIPVPPKLKVISND